MTENNDLFAGIDLSFTNTGIVIIDTTGKIVEQALISTKHKKDNPHDIEERIMFINTAVYEFLKKYSETLKFTLIEGLSFGSAGESTFQLAALNYFIRITLFQNKILFGSIPPTKLKKFVTGTGQCKKNLILKEVYKKWGMDFNDDNLCDAFSLAKMAQFNFLNKSR